MIEERRKVSDEAIKPKKKLFGAPEPRNVVIFVLDSVPEYQFKHAQPAYFTKLANSFNGFYYDDAWAPCNWTIPAMTALLCGRLPHSDGSEQVLMPDFEMIPNLNKVGYNTYFYTGFGITEFWPYKDQFSTYKSFFNTHPDKPELAGEEIVKEVENIKEPYYAIFLMGETHYWFDTPHFKMPDDKKLGLGRFYPKPKPAKAHLAYLLDKQVEAIRYLDQVFERIHKKLPGNPVVIVTADHGTVLRDDCDRYFHAWGNHTDMFHVPLLIYNLSMIKRLDNTKTPNGTHN